MTSPRQRSPRSTKPLRPTGSSPAAAGAAGAAGAATGAIAHDSPEVPGVHSSVTLASLRLAIGRGGVAIELDNDVPLGPVRLVDLSIHLPGLPFPVDVSGGVARFRHRRGLLSRLELDLDSERLVPHLARAFRGILSTSLPQIWLAVEPWGARIAVRTGQSALAVGPRPVLAFDLVIDPCERGVRLHILRARGVDLAAPARVLALRAVDAATHGLADREGGRFALESIPAKVAEYILPDVGVRMPAIESMQFAWYATAHRAGSIVASKDAGPELHEHVLRARELHLSQALIDDALVANDLPRARAMVLDALEIAPHEASLLHLVADLDRHAGNRAEAALSSLARSPRTARSLDGGLAGSLHEETGDVPAALATYTLSAERDDVAWVGAACFARAATLCDQPFDGLDWLDRAIVRDPTDPCLHGARVRVAYAAGRPGEARASTEHLDAMLCGAAEKYEVWLLAAQSASARGFGGEAIALFERALARVPDDPIALAGLGTAMIQERRIARGVALLHRALEKAEEASLPTASIALALAKALADGLDNLPGAIARVRRIPGAANEALEARLHEGRWRAALGDILGAGVAYAQFRELARLRVPADSRVRGDFVASGLLEAARFERHQHHDILAAQAHASVGMELRPTDAALRVFYRHISAELAFPSASPFAGEEPSIAAPEGAPAPRTEAVEAVEPATLLPTEASESIELPADSHADVSASDPLEGIGQALDMSFEDPSTGNDAGLEQRAAELIQRLQLDPTDDAVADELTEALTTLGRGHELLALLLARLEDASESRRPMLRERTRVVLVDLADRVESEGKPDEASLFRMAADYLP